MTAPATQPGAALAEEVGKLGEFIAVLQQEQELLKSGDTEALLPLIETKTRLANGLAALSQARETHLARLGLAAGRVGMDAWLARHGNDTLKKAWQDLLKLAGEARSLNELNGKLIGLHMRHNQQAFTALMGATDRAMTYGPDGQQQTGLGGRILGKA